MSVDHSAPVGATQTELRKHGPLNGMTLAELANTVNREHQEVLAALSRGVLRAIAAGEALIEARDRVERGQWNAWIEENLEVNRHTVRKYMRLATYQEQLLDSGRVTSVREAHKSLRGLPGIANTYGPVQPESVKQEGIRLHNEGVPYREVGRLLGVSPTTVRGWVDPAWGRERNRKSTERNRRRTEAKKALERQERDQAVRKHGGNVSKAYSLIRRCAIELDAAKDGVENREVSAILSSAMESLYRAEDDIVRALGLENGGDA